MSEWSRVSSYEKSSLQSNREKEGEREREREREREMLGVGGRGSKNRTRAHSDKYESGAGVSDDTTPAKEGERGETGFLGIATRHTRTISSTVIPYSLCASKRSYFLSFFILTYSSFSSSYPLRSPFFHVLILCNTHDTEFAVVSSKRLCEVSGESGYCGRRASSLWAIFVTSYRRYAS